MGMRIVIAKPGLDGHDRGAKVIARALRDAGHEVIYTGLRRTPTEIVRTVLDEDAVGLGLSTLSGAHDVLIPKICKLLRSEGMNDVIIFAGGIIPEYDREELFSQGLRAIFGPGTQTKEIINFLEEVSLRKVNGEPIGVGEELGWHWQ
ncbi:MAG: cobalamin B12-binding domain-containing protein [Euryarchaeota archaeon]|jgi:methylmalonyl-CoA mutase C-terminal domain/subunit|nr:cobalamin B12-binding domain-containing protein [Euryarchaeota archaeon]MBT3654065.1 cobalamin B12-binding domain-containing protein [Euryarchaeota archaeon]MBT3757701.1 cobalamin B12-binding domain-containing protein [Euryarchaeota archaeon]MBT4050503.1 cobalamin B12-binding domain-containing protein [Euryarchaeota archaeon]MBT4346944.1 cobalamin B12-binding domain-containing protein [Euryarchaeota archaeon]